MSPVIQRKIQSKCWPGRWPCSSSVVLAAVHARLKISVHSVHHALLGLWGIIWFSSRNNKYAIKSTPRTMAFNIPNLLWLEAIRDVTWMNLASTAATVRLTCISFPNPSVKNKVAVPRISVLVEPFHTTCHTSSAWCLYFNLMQIIMNGLNVMQAVPTQIVQRESLEVGIVLGLLTASAASVRQSGYGVVFWVNVCKFV